MYQIYAHKFLLEIANCINVCEYELPKGVPTLTLTIRMDPSDNHSQMMV